ncbi:MAG: ribbon-helix-helix protein, CopG family [bacterium]
MADRDRPRLNLTLDPDIKDRIKTEAQKLNVPVSRLVEEVLRKFLEASSDDPMVAPSVRKDIKDRQYQSDDTDPSDEAIQNILDRMDDAG